VGRKRLSVEEKKKKTDFWRGAKSIPKYLNGKGKSRKGGVVIMGMISLRLKIASWLTAP